jgi:hypothetical protein
MEIRKFIYSGKLREVLITKETPTNILGFDLSALDNNEQNEAVKKQLREDAPNLFEGGEGKKYITADAGDKPYPIIQQIVGTFKNFSKNKVEGLKNEVGTEKLDSIDKPQSQPQIKPKLRLNSEVRKEKMNEAK